MPVPRPRSAMRKIREILRLTFREGLSRRATAAATGLPFTTVSDHVARAERAGLGWPLPPDMDDARLEARLFARPEVPPAAGRPLPDWPTVQRELRRKDMTLQLLHLEYKAQHPDGYQYTQFCRRYRTWQGRLDMVMRQEHRAGDKLFVDWAGQTIPITDPDTGEVWQAQLAPRHTSGSPRRSGASGSPGAARARTCVGRRPWGRTGTAGVGTGRSPTPAGPRA